MKFLHPEFLYYMLPPLLILFGLLLTQKEAQASFFSDEVMEKLRVRANTLTLKARNALFFLAGFFMIVALAEPVIVDGKTEVKQKSADILIAIDISNSMLANDLYPNRLKLAKKKAIELIERLKQDRIGVIAFAKGSYLVSPLSFDHEAVAFLLKNLDTSSITEQGTNFLTLLDTAASSSKRSKRKYLLIFTDGGDKKDFSKEIEFAKENSLTVFIIATATKRGAPIRLKNGNFLRYKGEMVITKLNENIADLALATGGVYIEATNSDTDIEAMRREIEKTVQKKELKARTIEKYIPLFYIPLGMAMLLVLIALSSMTKRTKVYVPSMIILPLLLFGSIELKAGLLDFLDVKEAKETYAKKDFSQSAKKFETYAKQSDKPSAYYDAGNAYYKADRYEKAIEMYKKVHTKDVSLMAKNFHNLGNALAKTQKYKEAVEAYEDALKLKEDEETRHNLEEVKKLLQKQQQEKQQQKNDRQNNEQNKKEQNKQNQNDQSDANQNSKEKKQNDHKGKGNKQEKSYNKKEREQKSLKDEKKNDKQDKKSKLEKLQEQQNKGDQKAEKKPRIVHKEDKMSDEEEKKWLREINNDTQTFMYMMESKTTKAQEEEDEKPW